MFALRSESMSPGLVMVSRNVLNGIWHLEIRKMHCSIFFLCKLKKNNLYVLMSNVFLP